MTRVAIVGAGKASLTFIELFQTNVIVKLIGITDRDPEAVGLAIAKKWDIPVTADCDELFSLRPDIVINLTGDAEAGNLLRRRAPEGIDIMDSASARLLVDMVERQKTAKKEMETLYQNGLVLTSSKTLDAVLSVTLDKAMELTGTPAGSIALCVRNEMVMAASSGLDSRQLGAVRCKVRPGGMTSFILEQSGPVDIGNLMEQKSFDSRDVVKLGIQSILAYPLRINGDVVGILYLDDFKPREFTERHKYLISLFGTQAAQAIDKFRILDELYKVIAELDETTAYLQNVLEDSQDMILTTDTEGRIVEFSKGGQRILGYTRDEVIGMKASDLYVDGAERSAILDILERKGAICNYETRLVRKDGPAVDISLTISQLRNKTGKVIGTVGVSKDITEEKRLREELRTKNEELSELNSRLEEKVLARTRDLEKANRELTKTNQVKARFISNMSHELRTPLNSILGFSDILLEKTFGDLNEKQTRHVSNISASGKHLLQLVNNILDLAKIEAGKIELNYEEFSPKETITEVTSIMYSLANRKSIKIDFDISPDIKFFRADKVKFKQILYNLVSNAIKFSPEGGEVGVRAVLLVNKDSVLPWALEGQSLLKVSVWDRGKGIREEDIERIFEEFEQADTSLARDYQGTGLGLALTRRLVELHGGQIGVNSILGEGSEFVFYLPAAPSEPGREKLEEFVPLSTNYPWIKDEAPLILIVEDDIPTSEILTIHLTKAGYKVAHAYDGVEAIAKAKELNPFVITLDVMLPRKDGWEVLQAIKADQETRDIPVIMHSIIDNKDLAFTLGAADYLLKPVDKDILISKLGELSLMARRGHMPSSVLLVSADAATREYVAGLFDNGGFVFHAASKEDECVSIAMSSAPQIIMVDLAWEGLDVIRGLKVNPVTMNIPIVALADKDISMEDRLRMTGQIERVLRKDSLAADDLIMHIKDLEILHPKRAGLIDDLSGLFNHRYFVLRLAQEVSRAERYKSPLTLIMVDIDNFGHYVKTKGEYYGNIALRKIAELLRKNLRGSDVVIRYGGDAFSIILPNTPLAPAIVLGRRFNTIIQDYPFLYEEVQPKGRITVSIGIAALKKQDPEGLIKDCEKALSAALEKGGNTLEVFGGVE